MKKAILIILLSMAMLFTGNAFATISVDKLTLTCNPVNGAISSSQCYRDSEYFVRFQLLDSNIGASPIVDGNLQGWTIKIKYGPPDNAKQNTLTVQDYNLVKTSVCDTNNGLTDGNFTRSRYCQFRIPKISGIPNGTYSMDVNINEFSGHAYGDGNITSDLNKTITFTIDNALMNSSQRSIMDIIPIALVAGVIVILVGGIIALKSGMSVAAIIPGIIGMLVALIVIALLLAVVAGTG